MELPSFPPGNQNMEWLFARENRMMRSQQVVKWLSSGESVQQNSRGSIVGVWRPKLVSACRPPKSIEVSNRAPTTRSSAVEELPAECKSSLRSSRSCGEPKTEELPLLKSAASGKVSTEGASSFGGSAAASGQASDQVGFCPCATGGFSGKWVQVPSALNPTPTVTS